MRPKTKTLKNGVRVIVTPMPHHPTATYLVLTRTGTLDETKRVNGVSHFLEHVCFKGTPTRPTTQAISHELDALGVESNAFTTHEYTGFYAKGEARHGTRMLDVISDVYLNPTLPKEELEREKGVIVGEIDMCEDQPMDVVDDLLSEILYGDQPAGWRILGSKETVHGMTRGDIARYRKRRYTPGATVISIAGPIEPVSFFRTAERFFGSWKGGKAPDRKPVRIPKAAGPYVAVRRRPTSQTHIALGFHAPAERDKRAPALSILAAILGRGGGSSRLYQKVREEMGAGYYVTATHEASAAHGCFAVHAGVDNGRLSETLAAICGELRRIAREPVGEKELEKAKNIAIGGIADSLETSDDAADYFGRMLVRDLPITTPDAHIQELRRVTAQDVQRAACEIFTPKNAHCAVIAPKGSERSIKETLVKGL